MADGRRAGRLETWSHYIRNISLIRLVSLVITNFCDPITFESQIEMIAVGVRFSASRYRVRFVGSARYVSSQNGPSSEIESGWDHDPELLHLVDKCLLADSRLTPGSDLVIN